MTNAEIVDRFHATIDQFYAIRSDTYIKNTQLDFIGGVLQCALHILPTDEYFKLKEYIYQKHGYDPGGVGNGQIMLDDYEWEGD